MSELPFQNEVNQASAHVPENAQLMQLRDEAAAAAGSPDLRERVREFTARALHDRRLALEDMRAIVAAVTEGVNTGLSARGGELKAGLKQAVSGLDDAFGSAAQAATYTIREAVEQGRAFKDNELKTRLEELRDLETRFVDTLRQTARQSGGALRDELDQLAGHMNVAGTRTGGQVREALGEFAAGLKSSAAAGRAGLSESATAAGDKLSQVASGVLAAVSDSLKRQSERLRS